MTSSRVEPIERKWTIGPVSPPEHSVTVPPPLRPEAVPLQRLLVVTCPTGDHGELMSFIQRMNERGEIHVTVVAPAPGETDRLLEEISELGIAVNGFAGSADPMTATHEAIQNATFVDSIAVSIPSRRIKRWLRADLTHRLQRKYQLPVHRMRCD